MIDVIWVLLFWGLLALLWWFFAFEYRHYRIDLLRQQLFRIRDDLFQHARKGDFDFDSKAYGMTRDTLNGMIRFAHELSIWRILVLIIIDRFSREQEARHIYDERHKDAMEELTDKQRDIIVKAEIKMHVRVLAHIIYTCLPLFIVVSILEIMLKGAIKIRLMDNWKQFKNNCRNIYSHLWTPVDAEANEIGSSKYGSHQTA